MDNESKAPDIDMEHRCRIVLTFPWDGNVEIDVTGGGVVELFAAAAFLERSAHKLLAAAEHQAAMMAAPPTDLHIARSLPGGLDS